MSLNQNIYLGRPYYYNHGSQHSRQHQQHLHQMLQHPMHHHAGAFNMPGYYYNYQLMPPPPPPGRPDLLPFYYWCQFKSNYDSKKYVVVAKKEHDAVSKQKYSSTSSSSSDEEDDGAKSGQAKMGSKIQLKSNSANRPKNGQPKEVKRRTNKNFPNPSWQYSALKGQPAKSTNSAEDQSEAVVEGSSGDGDMEDEEEPANNDDECGYDEEDDEEEEDEDDTEADQRVVQVIDESEDEVKLTTSVNQQGSQQPRYQQKKRTIQTTTSPSTSVTSSPTTTTKSNAANNSGNLSSSSGQNNGGKVYCGNSKTNCSVSANGNQQLQVMKNSADSQSKPFKTRVFTNKNSQQQKSANFAALNSGLVSSNNTGKQHGKGQRKNSSDNKKPLDQQQQQKPSKKGNNKVYKNKKPGKTLETPSEVQLSTPIITVPEDNDLQTRVYTPKSTPAAQNLTITQKSWSRKSQSPNQYNLDDLNMRKKLKPDKKDVQQQQRRSTLHQYKKLNLSESELEHYMNYYLLEVDTMKHLGYPVECDWNHARAIIYKPTPTEFYGFRQKTNNYFDVNAQEFKPTVQVRHEVQIIKEDLVDEGVVIEKEETVIKDLTLASEKLLSTSPGLSSSGNSSASEDVTEASAPSSPRLSVSESETFAEISIPPSDEKKCCRCGRGFFVTVDGEYLTHEHCIYHWGKLQRVINQENTYSFEYSCCNLGPDAKGCSTHKLHVWSGLSDGYNGPFNGFLSTSDLKSDQSTKGSSDSFIFCADLDHLDSDEVEKKSDERNKIFALDCEMCFTGRGLELGKVTVVSSNGHLVYETHVKPDSEVIDFNTRFSGINESDFNSSKSLKEVQKDLLSFINSNTILIGHGLENDLRALKLIHKRIIDTSIAFPHYSGLPFRRSLKSLAKSILKRDIQTCVSGHDSYEDSRACIELMLWRVRKDFRTIVVKK